MSEVWGNPMNWSSTQWLAVLVLIFAILAMIILMQRLFMIIKASQKQTYKPNLRRLRRVHPDSTQSEQQEPSANDKDAS